MTTVPEMILEQLGGQRFIAMTGVHHLVTDKNTLRMQLPKNKSKANRLYITLEANDTYTVYFFKYTAGRLNKTTYQWTPDKTVDIATFNNVYADRLQEIFTSVTGMYTYL